MMVGATPAPAAQDNPFGKEHSLPLLFMKEISHQSCYMMLHIRHICHCCTDHHPVRAILSSPVLTSTSLFFKFYNPIIVIALSDTQQGLFTRLWRISGKITRTQLYCSQWLLYQVMVYSTMLIHCNPRYVSVYIWYHTCIFHVSQIKIVYSKFVPLSLSERSSTAFLSTMHYYPPQSWSVIKPTI